MASYKRMASYWDKSHHTTLKAITKTCIAVQLNFSCRLYFSPHKVPKACVMWELTLLVVCLHAFRCMHDFLTSYDKNKLFWTLLSRQNLSHWNTKHCGLEYAEFSLTVFYTWHVHIVHKNLTHSKIIWSPT